MTIELKGYPMSRHFDFNYETAVGALQIDRQEQLEGRKILDVCCGAARSVSEEIPGLDIYGFDILPAYSEDDFQRMEKKHGPFMTSLVRGDQEALLRANKKHPNRIICGDGTAGLPFLSSSFDVAVSCFGLPYYAQNREGAITSILEMIRVAKETVIFNIPELNKVGQTECGFNKKDYFTFKIIALLEKLRVFNIEYNVKREPHEKAVGIHLDVRGKTKEYELVTRLPSDSNPLYT
ncbi:MAG: class I SAM-dependent methyltransferase [Patescibacteria group bacterium]|nr:class I SAM-dependent methyltransferase [Patescibacteria group bacterium]